MDNFELIKDRVVAELMKTEVDDDRVQTIIDRLNEEGSFNDINYVDLSRTAGFPQRRHTSDLAYLASAYQSKSSTFFKSETLKETITLGFKYWVDNDFFGDNWHNNQISTPTSLVELMLLIGDELPADLVGKGQSIIGRAHMTASGARPSGDRIVIAGILAKNLLFKGDRAQFGEIIKLIESEVKFSTGSRGMQHDFSFHHREDRVNNTTSYGYGKYANAFGEWSFYVAKTEYAFSVEKINHLGGKVLTLSDSSGFIHDPDGIDADKLAFVKDLKGRRRGRIEEYTAEYKGATFHEGQRPWSVICDLAMPCATQNELNGDDARTLVGNGCIAVAEGANMPTDLEGVHVFKDAKILFAPGKAANAGGVAVSGLEMSQNSARISWKEEELQKLLLDIMQGIHNSCVEYGGNLGDKHIDYVRGANIAGFVKVADAMLAYGVV